VESKERVEIEAELREILREYVRYAERPIDPGDHLIFDLEIDGDDISFDLIPQVHRHFGIDPTARAWESAATVADVVALVERWRRATPEERAEAEAERESLTAARRRSGLRLLAVLGAGAGVQLAGGPGIVLLVLASALFWLWNLPAMHRESRRTRREHAAWKATRATRT
jgi:acyl carrier protein